MPPTRSRKRTDRLFEDPRRRRRLGPRIEEANEIICAQPGITVAELAQRMGVTLGRAWQIVNALEGHNRIVSAAKSDPAPRGP